MFNSKEINKMDVSMTDVFTLLDEVSDTVTIFRLEDLPILSFFAILHCTLRQQETRLQGKKFILKIFLSAATRHGHDLQGTKSNFENFLVCGYKI